MSALSIFAPIGSGQSGRAESVHRDDPTEEDRAAAELLRSLRAPRDQDDDNFIDDSDDNDDGGNGFVVTKVFKRAGTTARSIMRKRRKAPLSSLSSTTLNSIQNGHEG